MRSEPKWKNTGKCDRAPCLYIVERNLEDPKDTYISLEGLKKGYVWVNGRNLGRYWDIGPYLSLYCPGVWLTKGKNKIVILDFYTANSSIIIKTSKKPVFKKNP
jgi:beta-galactosidase